MSDSGMRCKAARREGRRMISGLIGSMSTQARPAAGPDRAEDAAHASRTPLGLNGDKDRLHLEAAYRLGSTILAVGWSSDRHVRFSRAPGRKVPDDGIFRHDRHDVAEALGLTSPEGLGFCVRLDDAAGLEALRVQGAADSAPVESPLPFSETIPEAHWPAVGAQVSELLATAPVGGALWREIRALIPVVPAERVAATGFLEGVMVSPLAEGAVVFGWALREAGQTLWLEGDEDTVVSFDDVFRQPRPDVLTLFSSKLVRDVNAGFVTFVSGLTERSVVRIWAASAAGRCIVSERGPTHTLPANPVQAGEQLTGVETSEPRMAERCGRVDWHVLAPLMQRQVEQFRTTPEARRDFGTRGNAPGDAPEVSLIVPLYGRYHFMEHQVMEFARDPWIRAHGELVYVIDDPALIDGVLAEAHRLHRLFGLPLSVVWSGLNFGFSGANNLGARVATGRHLLFLNSDVIPEAPGWLERMAATLEADAETGAVGAQLLFADGGVQHAGMAFEYDTRLGIWTNQHPSSGVAASLMAEAEPREVPALTGACLLLSREDFDAAGGWDMGYVMGDFEDSDLCLTLRRAGLRCVYEPRARLVHLERQSFGLIGLGRFRRWLTIANAQRHGERWSGTLAGIEAGAPA